MAPLYLVGVSILPLLLSLHGAFAYPDYAAQRIPLGGSLFHLEPLKFEARADAGDLGSDCGGDPDCITTDWGCQCGFTDGSWIEETPPPSSSSPLPTNVPGINGVPGCAYVIYPDGQACVDADYCNCGGTPAPLLTTTVDGTTSTNCNYNTVPTSECPKPTKAPDPPADPPKPDGNLRCNPSDGSHGYKKFSQSKAKDQISKLCQAYVNDGLVLSFEGDSLPDSKKYYDLEQVQGLSEDKSYLVINPNYAKAGCADINDANPLDFKAIGVDKCEEYFMRAVDGCPNFENANGDEFWKWGGQNEVACAFWNVNAS